MKQSNTRPAGKAQPAARRWHTPSRLLDLDDDLFMPAGHRPAERQAAPAQAAPAQAAPASAPRVDDRAAAAKATRRALAGAPALSSRAVVDTDSRSSRMQTPAPLEPRAPQIDPHRLQAFLVAAKERVARLEKTIEEQSQTLSSCHAQILELSNTRDRQADELGAARETIRAQEQSLAAERETAAKREAELTAAARKREAELTAAAQKRDAELTAAVQKRDAELADTVQ